MVGAGKEENLAGWRGAFRRLDQAAYPAQQSRAAASTAVRITRPIRDGGFDDVRKFLRSNAFNCDPSRQHLDLRFPLGQRSCGYPGRRIGRPTCRHPESGRRSPPLTADEARRVLAAAGGRLPRPLSVGAGCRILDVSARPARAEHRTRPPTPPRSARRCR